MRSTSSIKIPLDMYAAAGKIRDESLLFSWLSLSSIVRRLSLWRLWWLYGIWYNSYGSNHIGACRTAMLPSSRGISSQVCILTLLTNGVVYHAVIWLNMVRVATFIHRFWCSRSFFSRSGKFHVFVSCSWSFFLIMRSTYL
jgi:hypothetical protein